MQRKLQDPCLKMVLETFENYIPLAFSIEGDFKPI